MQPWLRYTYVGERFPEFYMRDILVCDIARHAGISYRILKNRMGLKKARGHNVVITDDDLLPKKRELNRGGQWRKKEKPIILSLSQKWLRKPII